MRTRNFLYRRTYEVTDSISIVIPTVGEVIADEDSYYSMLSAFISSPIDMMVQLDDMGIDFTEINDFELFLILFGGIKYMDTSLILDGIDLKDFDIAVDEESESIVLIDTARDIKIDKVVYTKIANALRKVHHIEKNKKKPANEDAKKYMIERARKKMNRNRGKQVDSQIESLIVAMVNTEQFKYNYEQVLNMSIYQFNESVRQIIKKVDYDNRMFGVYSGTISTKDLSQDELNWLTHK